MGSLGYPELIVIFFIALVVFGPRKLPELGKSLGKGLSEFKRASRELRNTLDDEIRDEERRTKAVPSTTATPAPAAEPAPVVEAELDAEPPADTVPRGAAEALSGEAAEGPSRA